MATIRSGGAAEELARRDSQRAAAFYERWTQPFVETFGRTLQAGTLKGSATGAQDHERSALLLAERARLVDGERVLDAGCGVGGPAMAIARRYRSCTIDGVTICPRQVELASQFIRDAGLEARVRVRHGDYHHLDADDDAYDVALFLESCGYSGQHGLLFAESARAVRSGGRIYVKDVFARDEVSDAQRADLDTFDELWGLASSPTLAGVSEALESAGCRIVRKGEIPHVGTGSFVAAVVVPDREGLFKLNEIGEHFIMRARDMPLFFGEVLAEVG